MAKITTHVLDTARGKPASGVTITLEMRAPKDAGGAYRTIATGKTDDDGRLRSLTDPNGVGAGTFRLTFDTGAYFNDLGQASFYPEAAITFVVVDESQHFHVPLLLAPFAYSTYRGS